MKEKLAVIGALVMVVGTCFGVYFYAEDRYALSEELRQTQQRLEYKITADQLRSVQDRIWKIIDRSGREPRDSTVREELRQLEEDKRQMGDRLREMEKK